MVMPRLKTPIVVTNSPVEFAVIGPDEGRYGVLIKSSNAGLDVIGAAGANRPRTTSLLSLLLTKIGDRKTIFSVESENIKDSDLNKNSKERPFYYRFVWKSAGSYNEYEIISEFFRKNSLDLAYSMKYGEHADVEWHMAHIIAEISQQEASFIEKMSRKKALYIATLFVYALFVSGLAVASFYLIPN